MALPQVHRVCQDQLGNVVPQVQCSVFNEGTAVLATLWQDDAGTIPQTNPMISSTNYGSINFYVLPGHYDLALVKPGYVFESLNDFQVPQDVASFGTMAQQNAASVAITGGSIDVDSLTVTSPPGAGYVAISANVSLADGAGRVALSLGGNAPSQMNGPLGIQMAPQTDTGLRLGYNKVTQNALVIFPTGADASGGAAHLFKNVAGSDVGSITTSATGTSFNTTSDARLKHAITPLTGALDVVRALKPSTGLWRSDGSRWQGFVANEVQEVVDGVITGEKDAVDEDGRIIPQQIDPSKLVVWLVGACQALALRVEALEAKLA